jgi:hypothetical protein
MIAKIMRVLKNMLWDGTKIHYKEIAVPDLLIKKMMGL